MSANISLQSSVLCLGLMLGATAQASDNPFLPKADSGFLVLAEGKCGGADSGAKPAEDKCDSDMKCGEGKCGDAMMSDMEGPDDTSGDASQDEGDDGKDAKCGGVQ